jgi:prepilin-type N-terminal cleavage/methylation domain-containing protein
MVRSHAAKLRAQRGFTLIEMMIVVAVIAILAIVVVPTFFRESRKVTSTTEVSATFAEFATKLEQYKVETGSYVDVAECPTTTSRAGSLASACAATWAPVRINPPEAKLKCKYVVDSGLAIEAPDPLEFPGFTMATPATSWYWILATCDMDNSPTLNATYFTNSLDSSIQKQNEGN